MRCNLLQSIGLSSGFVGDAVRERFGSDYSSFGEMIKLLRQPIVNKEVRRRQGVPLGNVPVLGFTLLELIISVAILSSGIVVILQALSFSAKAAAKANSALAASLTAREILEKYAYKKDIQEGVETGQENGYAYTAAITQAEENSQFTLNLEVRPKQANRYAGFLIDTLLVKYEKP